MIWAGDPRTLTQIIRNYPKDRFGTKVPFSGTFEHPTPDIIATIFNAFRKCVRPGVRRKIRELEESSEVEPEKKQ